MIILRNSVKCLLCNDEIISAHRHDFKWCKCGNVAVDGGHDMLKRNFKSDIKEFAETSIVKDLEETVLGNRSMVSYLIPTPISLLQKFKNWISRKKDK